MSNIFNIKRFGRYFTTECVSCISNYGLGMLLMAFMGVVIYVGTVLMGLIVNGEWCGPSENFRIAVFILSMSVMVVTVPVKCYGRITEKNAGRDWLLVPVSRVEKMLGMVLMTVFVVPVAVGGIYLSLDFLMCALDGTCGQSIINAGIPDDLVVVGEASEPFMNFIRQVTCPWLYIDDFIGACLIFLLGAIFFRSGKTVKTILVFIGFCLVLGIVLKPVVELLEENMAGLNEAELFSKGIFRHVALYDTLNDTVTNILLLSGIYLRIKTLKH